MSNEILQLYDRIRNDLPVHVPKGSSMLYGILAAIFPFCVGILITKSIKTKLKDSDSVLEEHSWFVSLVCTFILASKFYSITQDFIYKMDCIRLNKQHFANVHWLKLYMDAYRGQ